MDGTSAFVRGEEELQGNVCFIALRKRKDNQGRWSLRGHGGVKVADRELLAGRVRNKRAWENKREASLNMNYSGTRRSAWKCAIHHGGSAVLTESRPMMTGYLP